MIGVLVAAAVSAAQPRSILFVGNSFTFGALSNVMTYRKDSVTDLNGDGIGGVPALFKRFAEEEGLNYQVSLETAPGQTLAWHLANKRNVLDQSWDAVVLQQYSTLDPDKPGDPASTVKAARDLARLFLHRNPKVDLSLVATWTRPDLTFPAGKHWSGQPVERMALDLRAADNRVRSLVPAIRRVVPVGQAFNCAIARKIAAANPYEAIAGGRIDLWASDHYHASSYGYYLEALTVFAAVTRSDPRTLGRGEKAAGDLGIPPQSAAKLQRIAFQMAMFGRCGGH